jgi:hypothetical protein
LIESWFSQNVPIWAGLHREKNFNSRSYIDVTDLNIEEISSMMREITIEELTYIRSQPLMLIEPSLDNVFDFFKKLI